MSWSLSLCSFRPFGFKLSNLRVLSLEHSMRHLYGNIFIAAIPCIQAPISPAYRCSQVCSFFKNQLQSTIAQLFPNHFALCEWQGKKVDSSLLCVGKGSSFKVLVPSSQHSSTVHNYTRHLSGSDTVFIPFHSSMGNEANIDVSEHSTTIVLCSIPGKKRVWQTQVKFLG